MKLVFLTISAWPEKEDKVELLPVKKKKLKRKNRYFHYLVSEEDDSIVLLKQTARDIWKNLYQFPVIEDYKKPDENGLAKNDLWKKISKNSGEKTLIESSEMYQQKLTHQDVYARFYKVKGLSDNLLSMYNQSLKVNKKHIHKYAFPKIIFLYLKKKVLDLNFS